MFNLATVDLLARVRLATGARIVSAPDELWDLLDLCGLREVLAVNAAQPGQASERAMRPIAWVDTEQPTARRSPRLSSDCFLTEGDVISMCEPSDVAVLDLDEMEFSPTAWLFEGGPRAGVGISIFVVRTPPGGSVDLHTHPYPETFLLLEGRGHWTVDNEVVEVQANQILAVQPHTPHGFRNVGDEPLLIVSVHEAATLEQTFPGRSSASETT